MLQEDEQMAKALASMRYVRCNYKKHMAPESFLYDTLSALACLEGNLFP